MALNLDLHIHSDYSYDAKIPVEQIVGIAKQRGLHGIAVTDHNRLTKVEPVRGFFIIPGEEIRTKQGDLIGLGIRKTIPGGMDVDETQQVIKEMGGIVIVPHPFESWRHGLSVSSMNRLTKPFIVEVLNGRDMPRFGALAKQYAKKHNLPTCAGSDAHLPQEIGGVYTKLPNFLTVDSILKGLMEGKGEPVGKRQGLHLQVKSFLSKYKEK